MRPLLYPETITQDEYDHILKSGKPGPIKRGYPAVIMHPDQTVTKIWAKKSGLFSSARWKPYSTRFVSNAHKLASLGINVPPMISHGRIEKSHIHLVRYGLLEGTSVRDLLESDPQAVDIQAIANYIYHLHEKGIIFRAIHYGNIIQMPNHQYGLIDFTDVVFLKKSAPIIRRAANIATPLRYKEDVARMKQAGLPSLRGSYLKILCKKEANTNEEKFHKVVRKYTSKG